MCPYPNPQPSSQHERKMSSAGNCIDSWAMRGTIPLFANSELKSTLSSGSSGIAVTTGALVEGVAAADEIVCGLGDDSTAGASAEAGEEGRTGEVTGAGVIAGEAVAAMLTGRGEATTPCTVALLLDGGDRAALA